MMSVAAIETDPPQQEALEQRPDRARQFDAAVLLAWFLARPFAFLSDAQCQLGPVDGSTLKALAQSDAFRGPLNRQLSVLLATDAETISQEAISRLAISPELRLATVILTAPLHEARNVALMLAAALLSRRVRSLMLKRDRTAIQEALGLIGYDVAIQEAPLLYPLLSTLDRTPADYPLFRPDSPLAERQALAVQLGFQLIGRFLDAVEPPCARMYARRLPRDAGYADRETFVASLDEAHCRQFLRMIRRRQDTWSDIIG